MRDKEPACVRQLSQLHEVGCLLRHISKRLQLACAVSFRAENRPLYNPKFSSSAGKHQAIWFEGRGASCVDNKDMAVQVASEATNMPHSCMS